MNRYEKSVLGQVPVSINFILSLGETCGMCSTTDAEMIGIIRKERD